MRRANHPFCQLLSLICKKNSVKRYWNNTREQAAVLSALAPYLLDGLPSKVLQQCLQIALSLPDELEQVKALEAWIPYLTEAQPTQKPEQISRTELLDWSSPDSSPPLEF